MSCIFCALCVLFIFKYEFELLSPQPQITHRQPRRSLRGRWRGRGFGRGGAGRAPLLLPHVEGLPAHKHAVQPAAKVETTLECM